MTRIEIQGQSGRSQSPVRGGAAILFGSPFVAVGLFMVVMSAGEGRPGDAPQWVLTLVGFLFSGAGVFVGGHGIADILRRRRQAKLEVGETWMRDHPWRTDEARDENLTRAGRALGFAAFMLLFLTPFNWFAFLSGGAPMPVKGIIAFFDLLGALVAWSAVYGFLQVAKFGRTSLGFERFPYFLGETLSVRFRIPPRFGGVETVRFTLRAIEEAYETRGAGRNRSKRVICYELHRDETTRELRMPELDEGRDVPVTFEIPADGPPTRLGERPATYWEVEAKAEAPGIDYSATFLVPIYARSDGTRPAENGSRLG